MESLAIKYRPKKFEDVVEQNSTVTILRNQLETNSIKHCYLFCGGAGTGKTTCARIFANELNKGRGSIIELDAASNNSVDNMRVLVDQVRIPPSGVQYKVYIIDEVHMLSQAAFNAFLKTLEEPPAYAKFIMATTEKHKILPKER